jgi:hypothetical protein
VAQAYSVPNSSRQLITAESANQSTILRAANLPAVTVPAVRVNPTDRRYLVDGSNARVIIGSEKAPFLRLWREKRGDEPEDLLKCRYYGANAGQAPVGSNIVALCYANAVFFLGRLLWRVLQILLLFVRRNKRLRNSALDKASTHQLVQSRPQGRLR